MKLRLLCAFFVILILSLAAAAQAKPEDAAKQSAAAWLAIVDSGKYAASWDETATTFKAALSRQQWEQALEKVRAPLGKVRSRNLKSATYTKSLPGAPDGEYVVIQYDTEFEQKASAVETVVPMLDKDGKWRVSGYFIK
jgi:uncharacterized protein DUF4019